MTASTSRRSLACTWLAIAGALAGLSVFGRLSLPPVSDPAKLATWWTTTGPVASVFDCVQVLVIALGGYWLTLVAAMAGLSHRRHDSYQSRLRLPGAGHVARILIGASSAAATGLGASIPASAQQSEVCGPSATKPATKPVNATDLAPVLTNLTPATHPGQRAAPANMWVVRPGDNFWSIAETVVAASSRTRPTDGEVERYWHPLISANARRLPRAGDPNLIRPPMKLSLPPPPP